MSQGSHDQQTILQSAPGPEFQPKSVKVQVSTGAGMDIEWKDGHSSHYTFQWLRDACPCAVCDDKRTKEGREPGDPEPQNPMALPMFKPAMKPDNTEGVGRYAIRFFWNDRHEAGIYSWEFLREHCPCPECKAKRAAVDPTSTGPVQ